MKISDLYFGVMIWDPNRNQIRLANLFSSKRVQRSVAIYRARRVRTDDPLRFCFGDTDGRAEYTLAIQDPYDDKPGEFVYVYGAYVFPNRDHLLSLVHKVSRREAKRWLKQNRY